MEESIPGRSQAKDGVVQTSSRPTMWRIVFDSSKIIGSQARRSTGVGCSSVLAATDYETEPRCAIYGPCGYAQDLVIGGSTFPLARAQRRCTIVCEDLPHLLGGEV